jgi:DNA-binding response OmpR family regulator
MPGRPDLDVVAEARRRRLRTPILMLTARDPLADRVTGLDTGADDYLVKPFESDDLLARLRAPQRRPASSPSRPVRWNTIRARERPRPAAGR